MSDPRKDAELLLRAITARLSAPELRRSRQGRLEDAGPFIDRLVVEEGANCWTVRGDAAWFDGIRRQIRLELGDDYLLRTARMFATTSEGADAIFLQVLERLWVLDNTDDVVHLRLSADDA